MNTEGVAPSSVYDLLDFRSNFSEIITATFSEQQMVRLLARKVLVHSMRHMIADNSAFDAGSEGALYLLIKTHDTI